MTAIKYRSLAQKPSKLDRPNKALSSHFLSTLATLSMIVAILPSTAAYSADLLQVYEMALKHEPEWSAQRAQYLSNREAEKIGLAGILPQVNLTARHAKVNYDVDADSTLTLGSLISLPLTDTFECSDSNDIFVDDLTAEKVEAFSECATTAQGGTDTSFTVTDTALNVTQPLFRLDRWYSYKQSQAITDKAEIEYQLAQQDLILRVADTYFNTLKAWEQVEFTRNEEKAIRKQLRATQKRFQKGLIKSTDVYEAQAIFDLAQSTRFTAENLFRGTVEDLEQMTRAPGIEIIPLPSDLPIAPPSPNDSEAWVSAAQKNSLDLQAAKFTAQAARSNHKVKKSNHAPTVDFLASFSQSSADGRTSTMDQGDTRSSSIGITLNVPIFTGGGTSANERKAKYQMREAEYRVEQVSQQIVSNTRKAFRSVTTSVHRIEALNVAIASNQKALNAVKKGYKVGTRNVAEVLQAQRELFSAYKDHANARYDYILDTLRLKRATGVLNTSDLSNLNAWLSQDSSAPVAPMGSPPNVIDPRDAFEATKSHSSSHSKKRGAQRQKEESERKAKRERREQRKNRAQKETNAYDKRMPTPSGSARPRPTIESHQPDKEKPETFMDIMKGWF